MAEVGTVAKRPPEPSSSPRNRRRARQLTLLAGAPVSNPSQNRSPEREQSPDDGLIPRSLDR